MVRLEELKRGLHIDGLSPAGTAEVISVDWLSDQQLEVTYRTGKGLDQRILVRGDEERLSSATARTPFSFDGNAENFRLAAEAHRIALAHLFDPYLALTSADIEALPHQITAVYGEMLERQPLRFLLADDPGPGKTIMAGLFIKELMICGDLKRCMIVAPGSLVEQWQGKLNCCPFIKRYDLEMFARLENTQPFGRTILCPHQCFRQGGCRDDNFGPLLGQDINQILDALTALFHRLPDTRVERGSGFIIEQID